MIYTPRQSSDRMVKPPEPQRIRLAPAPFDIPPAVRDETAPRMPPIRRGGYDAPRTLGPVARRIFEYGESQNWKCTVQQAAEALGMSVQATSNRSLQAGFGHKFVGYVPRSSQGENPGNQYAGAEGALTNWGHGANIDPNLLPLDKLIRSE